MTYRFGEFKVDVAAYELRRGSRRLPLGRQPMDLLLLLPERRQELVSREEIAKRKLRQKTLEVMQGLLVAIIPSSVP